LLDQEFTADTLRLLREAVLAKATASGMPEDRATDVMLAVHELAANAVRHGGGCGQLRMHIMAGVLHCQVTDPGIARFDGHPVAVDPEQARARDIPRPDPWPYLPGHGLDVVWTAADQVTAITGPAGSQVTVSFSLPGAS
jgi:anti-sigma regulatory factor (Ser/Thr protein kinase)